MFLGRAITNGTGVGLIDFIEVTTEPNIETLDTIIIGKKRAEDIVGKDKVKVLEQTISDNVRWCFARNEKRDNYKREIDKFNRDILKRIKKKITYQYIDLYNLTYSEAKMYLTALNSNSTKFVYLYKNHLYLIGAGKSTVFGLSLSDCEYCGIKREKFLKKLQENNNTYVFSDISFISEITKDYLAEDKYLIPYFFSLLYL